MGLRLEKMYTHRVQAERLIKNGKFRGYCKFCATKIGNIITKRLINRMINSA